MERRNAPSRHQGTLTGHTHLSCNSASLASLVSGPPTPLLYLLVYISANCIPSGTTYVTLPQCAPAHLRHTRCTRSTSPSPIALPSHCADARLSNAPPPVLRPLHCRLSTAARCSLAASCNAARPATHAAICTAARCGLAARCSIAARSALRAALRCIVLHSPAFVAPLLLGPPSW